MKKLEIKHIYPYLPYGLKVNGSRHLKKYGHVPVLDVNGLSINSKWQYEFIHEDGDLTFAYIDDPIFKPILRPFSDLNKDIEGLDASPFVILSTHVLSKSSAGTTLSICETEERCFIFRSINITRFVRPVNYPYWLYDKLIEWHFDVFGLIDQGLAIDINTLSDEK